MIGLPIASYNALMVSFSLFARAFSTLGFNKIHSIAGSQWLFVSFDDPGIF
jgi:hypothetical protein